MEIVYTIAQSERRKGHGTEATQLFVDYLFLSNDLARIQAIAGVRNKASQRVLEKQVSKEREQFENAFSRGELRDYYLYSILREEWKEPKILTRTEKK